MKKLIMLVGVLALLAACVSSAVDDTETGQQVEAAESEQADSPEEAEEPAEASPEPEPTAEPGPTAEPTPEPTATPTAREVERQEICELITSSDPSSVWDDYNPAQVQGAITQQCATASAPPRPTPTPEPTPEPLSDAQAAFVEEFRAAGFEDGISEAFEDRALAGLGVTYCNDMQTTSLHSLEGLVTKYRYSEIDVGGHATIAQKHLCPDVVPFSFSGTGDDVLVLGGSPLEQFALMHATHNGGSNFQVTIFDANGDRVDGLINHIGAYDGRVFYADSDIEAELLQVSADGAWTLRFDHIALGVDWDPTTTIEGFGDELMSIDTEGEVVLADFACLRCDSNVFVRLYGNGRTVVNEIGSYEGTIIVPADTLLIEVVTSASRDRGDSSWTLSPSE